MRVTFLGHAGLRSETAGASVLIDPWLSPYGAFQASWFPYPDNQHLVGPSLFAPTAVVISHEHRDHVDEWVLSRLAPGVPVVIPHYASPVLRRKVESCGARPIIEAQPWEWVDLGGDCRVFFVTEDSPMNHDAAAVLVGGGRVLLDLNDARLSPSQLRAIRAEVGGRVDLLTFQASGASWHPMCYSFSEERKRALSRQKRVAKLSYADRVVKVVEPVAAAPFAGPPCFLDPALFRHNDEMEGGVFPDQQQAADWLQRRGTHTEVLLPGDVWDTDGPGREPDPEWQGFTFAERRPYLDDYAARRAPLVSHVLSRHPDPGGSQWEAFGTYFERLLSMSGYFNGRIGMRVGFDILGSGGGPWAVDFRPGSEGVYDTMGDCAYTYRFASRWLVPILDGTVPWEDFLLSLRFEARRDPDVHNEHLLGLLKFAHQGSLDTVEHYETTVAPAERIVVEAEGVTYSVQRHCPHAGADLLETSEILPGRALRCLNHYYEFDLETGACTNGVCPPLDTFRTAAAVDAPALRELH